MQLIWELGPSTVRDVYEVLRRKRKIAYTTVMTMMKVLERKGHLSKSTKERAYLYRPVQSRQDVLRGMVREFLNRVFDGSVEPLLLHLVEDNKVTAKELDEIRRLLEERE